MPMPEARSNISSRIALGRTRLGRRRIFIATTAPDAIRHLFRVASSLDSMVVGEPQILGQLKSAYAMAKEHGAISGFLDLVMTRAFNVAKRVRSETDIGESAVSISYAAVELAREIFGSLDGKRVLVVGRGEDGGIRCCVICGAPVCRKSSSPIARGSAPKPLAEEFQGRVIDYDIACSTRCRKSISCWPPAPRRITS